MIQPTLQLLPVTSGNQGPCTTFGVLGYPWISLGYPGITFQKTLSQGYPILIPNSIFLVWDILGILENIKMGCIITIFFYSKTNNLGLGYLRITQDILGISHNVKQA